MGKEFEINKGKNTLQIKYIGDNPNIGKCVNELSDKFATYHYIEQLESRIKELEVCQHPYKYLERNENGLFCNKCKTQISSDPNIY